MTRFLSKWVDNGKSMVDIALESYNNNIEEFKEFATWKKPQISHGKRILISATLMPI